VSDVKTIVCLANSRKHSGRCLAGLELIDGSSSGWVRPISDRPTHEVSEQERRYQDGTDPAVLDVINIPLLSPAPTTFQQENWLLDPGYYWQKVGQAAWTDLDGFEDDGVALWINGYETYHGTNNRVPSEQAAGLTNSLRLIRVEAATLLVHVPGAAFSNPKRAVEASFVYAGEEYCLRVTDPVYESRYLARDDGEYEIGEAFLTISLGEEYDGYAYKLVAGVFERSEIE
jgi:hypothetical protein